MKILSRDFSLKEKLLLLVLLLLLLGLVYYRFVHVPVNESLEKAADNKASLEIEVTAVETKAAQLAKMKAEIDDITASGAFKSMPSYSNRNQVITLLNDVLGSLGYSATFDAPYHKDGSNQVRRNISLQFTAPDYETVESVLARFAGSEYRCLIGNVSVTSSNRKFDESGEQRACSVNCTLTFFETLAGGAADDELRTAK